MSKGLGRNISEASLNCRPLLVLCFALMLGACLDSEATSDEPPAPVALVSTVRPATSPELLVAGRVVARNASVAVSESGGRVLQVLTRVGERVRAGEVLAVLEASSVRQRAAAAAADILHAESALAERGAHLERTRALIAAGVGTQAELDSAVAAASAAQATLATARAAGAQVERSLAETLVRASVEGVVAAQRIQVGLMLEPGAVAFEIDGDGVREIEATIPEGSVALLSPGTVVSIATTGAQGRAQFLAAASRSGAGGARLARFSIEGQAPPSGATVELRLATESGAAQALVPVAAVIADSAGARRVLVVGEDGALRAVPVELVSLSAAGMLVRGALQPGERVVAAGANFLTPGTRVRSIETRN